MTNMLDNTKRMIQTTFEKARADLQNVNIDINTFVVQVAVYRNYNWTAEKLLQSSPWIARPEELQHFLANIVPEGGWGNEAKEAALK